MFGGYTFVVVVVVVVKRLPVASCYKVSIYANLSVRMVSSGGVMMYLFATVRVDRQYRSNR